LEGNPIKSLPSTFNREGLDLEKEELTIYGFNGKFESPKQ
jgi:hypothetical protein